MKKHFFVTGIGTDVGKTIISALLVESLQADYWKPIQSGDLKNSDSKKIKKLISNSKSKIHSEKYRFKIPASPHYSAQEEGIKIQLKKIKKPSTKNHLIIEGAGGILVPMNQKNTYLDLIKQLNLPVILVANYYLGSINHTLLSIEILHQHNIPIHALVFNGTPTKSTRDIIFTLSKNKNIKHIIDIPKIKKLNPKNILKHTHFFKNI